MVNHSRTSTPRRSFVLADALIATVVLAGSLAVVISLAGRALSAQHQGERLQTVAMLLDEQLNQVLMRGPDNYESAYPMNGQCDAPFQDYSFVLAIDGGTGGTAYEVSATISWVESGRARSEMISTLIAPRLGEEPDPDRMPTQTILRE